jgi:hypothetical protein
MRSLADDNSVPKCVQLAVTCLPDHCIRRCAECRVLHLSEMWVEEVVKVVRVGDAVGGGLLLRQSPQGAHREAALHTHAY